MTDFPNHNDDTLFDRLVDGELSTAERQQLLASLDDPQGAWRDQGWRRCALAFVEAQTWGHQFKQLLAEGDDKPAASQPPTVAAQAQMGRWLAIAASLLLAFSLGWIVHSPPAANQQQADLAVSDPPIVEQQEQLMPDELPDELPVDISDDAVTLLVRDTSGKNQRVQVPLMEVGEIDNQFGTALPTELRAQFRDSGYDLLRRRRFAPMFFEQNEKLVPMVVPVDDTYVVPVSSPVY